MPSFRSKDPENRGPYLLWSARFLLRMIAGCLLVLVFPQVMAIDLVTAYQLALKHDPDFRIAEAELRAGLQAAPEGRAELLPRVNLSINSSLTEQKTDSGSEDINRDSATLSASMPLINTGAWHRAAAGALSARAARADYRETVQILLLKVAEHYLEVLRAEDALKSARALRENMQKQVEQVRLRHTAGLTSINELEEARYGLDNAKAVYIAADSSLQTARLALSAITNQPTKKIYKLDKDFREWPPDMSPTELVTLALKKNRALQALRLQRDSARALSRGAAANHLPTLDLNLSQSTSETDQFDNLPPQFSDALPSQSTDTTVSLAFRLPLFDGGGISARKRRQAAQYESINQRVVLTERNLRQQMLALHARILSSVATIQANRQALRSAISAEKATLIRYQTGTRNILDISTASRITHDARRRYQDSVYGHILLRLQMEQAIGDLNLDDLQLINAWLKPDA